MMKTTLALAAIAATATATTVSTTKTLAEITALTECTASAAVDVAVAYGTSAYKVNYAQVTGADAAACVTAIAGTQTDDADACFVSGPVNAGTFTPGKALLCPVASGTTCTKADPTAATPVVADKCQGKDATADIDCTTDTCLYIAPAKALSALAKYKVYYEEAAKQTIPEPILKAITDAATECGITSPAYGAPADKKGLTYRSTNALNKDCDVAKYKSTIQDAVDAYNKDATEENKYLTEAGEVKVVDVKAECFDTVTGQFNCATTEGCDILCADKVVCTEAKVCGSGVCKDTSTPAPFIAQQDPVVEKHCFSSAVSVAASAVVAAALAVAFF